MDTNQSFGPINSPQMINENNPNRHHNYRMIFITVLVLILAVGGFVILRNDEFKGRMQEALNLVDEDAVPINDYNIEDLGEEDEIQDLSMFSSDIAVREEPWVEIAIAGDGQASVGEEVTFYVTAFSNEKDITGYDLLIGIDPEYFQLQSISSEMENFQLFQFDKGIYQSITGIKDIQVEDPTVFDNARLLRVVAQPIKEGETVVTILPSKGQERSQLVDKDVQVLTPQVGSVTVNIR